MADADDRVERSLDNRAIGYSYDAVKIFCDKNGKVTRVPCREHVRPRKWRMVIRKNGRASLAFYLEPGRLPPWPPLGAR